MSSYTTPREFTHKASGVLAAFLAVKFGADSQHVVAGAANTDRCVGIAQNAATAAGDPVVVAYPGGGAKAILGETVVAGNDLVSGTDGRLVLPNAANDEIIARACEGGVANQIIGVEVYYGIASGAQ